MLLSILILVFYLLSCNRKYLKLDWRKCLICHKLKWTSLLGTSDAKLRQKVDTKQYDPWVSISEFVLTEFYFRWFQPVYQCLDEHCSISESHQWSIRHLVMRKMQHYWLINQLIYPQCFHFFNNNLIQAWW